MVRAGYFHRGYGGVEEIVLNVGEMGPRRYRVCVR